MFLSHFANHILNEVDDHFFKQLDSLLTGRLFVAKAVHHRFDLCGVQKK